MRLSSSVPLAPQQAEGTSPLAVMDVPFRVAGTAHQRRRLAWVVAGVALVAAVSAGAYVAGRHAAAPAVQQAAEVAPAANNTAAPAAPEAPAAAKKVADAAPACAQCGVVESVEPVRRKGDGSGLGAAAGGVVGGVLGHQVGAGSGRTAMTVLGAVAGGFAGNEIEKRAKTVTVYRTRVRMEDGEVRTFERSQAMTAGQRVRVDGSRLTLLDAKG